jgi:hypothetical protein
MVGTNKQNHRGTSNSIYNREDPLAKQQLQEDLRQVAANYRDFLFTASMRYIKVLEPAAVLREMEMTDSWGDDAIHPSAAAYSRIAASVIRLGEGGISMPVGIKRPRSNSDAPEPSPDRRQRSSGWQPLGEGRFMRYSDQECEASQSRRGVSAVEADEVDEHGGGRSSAGGGGGGRTCGRGNMSWQHGVRGGRRRWQRR